MRTTLLTEIQHEISEDITVVTSKEVTKEIKNIMKPNKGPILI